MIETLYNNIFPNNCMIRKSTIYLSLPLFLSTGKQIHFDCSDVSRILPDGNMSGLKNPDKHVLLAPAMTGFTFKLKFKSTFYGKNTIKVYCLYSLSFCLLQIIKFKMSLYIMENTTISIQSNEFISLDINTSVHVNDKTIFYFLILNI